MLDEITRGANPAIAIDETWPILIRVQIITGKLPCIDVLTKPVQVFLTGLSKSGRKVRDVTPRKQLVDELEVCTNTNIRIGAGRRQDAVLENETQIADDGVNGVAMGLGALEIVGQGGTRRGNPGHYEQNAKRDCEAYHVGPPSVTHRGRAGASPEEPP